MMLAKFLAVVFLATLAVAELPSFVKVCGRRNPNLDKCVMDAMEQLRDKLKAGIPEINIPPQDPFHIKEFSLSNTESFKASAHDVTVRGIGDFIIESQHVDLKAQQFDSVLRFKKIIIDGEYDVDSKVVIPIRTHGPIHIEADDVTTNVIIKYKHVNINGADHIRYTSVTTSLAVKDWKTDFTPTSTTDSTLVTAINAALEGGRKEIFESLRPHIEKVISNITMDLARKVTDKVSYDDLFPDRE